MKMKFLSRLQLFVTPWTVTYQAPPTMGFSRQEYWSGVPFPSPIQDLEAVLPLGFVLASVSESHTRAQLPKGRAIT